MLSSLVSESSPSDSNRITATLLEAHEAVAPFLGSVQMLMRGVVTSSPLHLMERMDQLIVRPGKQIRATLLGLWAGVPRRTVPASASLAAAFELLHLASLAHDDVIDEAEIRRGGPSAPRRWGNQMAVLVGDYAFARSMELALDTGILSAMRSISVASCHLVAGEVAELDLAASNEPSLESYTEVIRLKTAALLESCCEVGAISAGLTEVQVKAAAHYGHHFGMAFQMVDDLLDLVSEDSTGKPQGIDLRNGLVNLPVVLARQTGGLDPREQDWDLAELRSAVRSPEAARLARSTIGQELTEARRALEQAGEAGTCAHLQGLVEVLEQWLEDLLSWNCPETAVPSAGA